MTDTTMSSMADHLGMVATGLEWIVITLELFAIGILLLGVVLSEIPPEPRAFRVTEAMTAAGEAPASETVLGVAITKRGIYMPSPVFERGLGTVGVGEFQISLTWLVLAAAVAASIWAARRQAS